jgi:NIMA (never in mitosis gene a)-related kinase
VVFVVEDRLTRGRYVMKQLQLRSDDREFALRESQLLRTLRHPNICRHHESFVHKGEWLCVVMPYCSNGDLAQLFA